MNIGATVFVLLMSLIPIAFHKKNRLSDIFAPSIFSDTYENTVCTYIDLNSSEFLSIISYSHKEALS
jgi:hypothetical protein